MFKQLLTACAGVVLSGSMAMANINGSYSCQSNDGQTLAISLQSDGDVVRGTLVFNGNRMPLVGRESNGAVRGVWQAPGGQDVPFAAAEIGDSIRFQTNGMTVSMDRAQAAPAPQVPQQPERQQPERPAQRQGIRFDARMVQGDIFQYPVPQDWTHEQSTNSAIIAAPDHTMSFGFSGLERIQTGTPTQFLHFMVENVYQLKIERVLSADRVVIQGSEMTEFVYTTRSQAGVEYRTWARVAIVQGSNGYVLFASSTSDQFDRVIGGLKQLADGVQITNQNAAFERDKSAAIQRNSTFNHPMDHSFADDYWKRSRITDDVMRRGSDVRRDSYISTDPRTGQRWSHDGSAYDPARGGVANPDRPEENLDPAPHWRNW